jgi:transposase-like protein
MLDVGEKRAVSGNDGGRRLWSADLKRRIVAESFEPGASVAVVARRHGVNANLLFTWRRRFVAAGSARPRETMSIVPVAIAAEDSPEARGAVGGAVFDGLAVDRRRASSMTGSGGFGQLFPQQYGSRRAGAALILRACVAKLRLLIGVAFLRCTNTCKRRRLAGKTKLAPRSKRRTGRHERRGQVAGQRGGRYALVKAKQTVSALGRRQPLASAAS